MEISSPDNFSKLASMLTIGETSHTGELLPGDETLPDECGDSLWERVLAQDKDAISSKNFDEKKICLISNINIQECRSIEAK